MNKTYMLHYIGSAYVKLYKPSKLCGCVFTKDTPPIEVDDATAQWFRDEHHYAFGWRVEEKKEV